MHVKSKTLVSYNRYALPEAGAHRLAHRPLIIGFGPAGMAAALALSKKGYRPLVLERGPSIQERKEAVRAFWEGGKIDPEANVQFGEGGAGAFSDGKLTTRIKDPRVSLVLEALINAGADRSIAWTHHPHIGTDALVGINENLRHTVEKLGGEIRFRSRVDDLLIQNGSVCGVRLSSGEEIPAEVVILAIGHSARDTMRMLATKSALTMEPKNFAVGVRVEHLQTFINHRQYRYATDFEKLPAAEYHLAHTAANGKGVYSFCMCPGGYVVDGASASHTIVTNGMSYADRAGRKANSAIVVQVGPADFGEDLFGGINFQEELERKAWLLGKGKAPVQRIAHFLNPTANPLPEDVIPTFPRQAELTDMHALFGGSVLEALEECDLTAYFDFVLSSDEVHFPKPHPDVYLKAAAMLTADPQACIVYEDSTLGIQAGKRAGMYVIARRDDRYGQDQSQADRIVENSVEMLKVINGED